jgi:DNA-binding response OmpR family regulator
VKHSLLIVEDDGPTAAFLAVLLDLALEDGSGLDLLDRVRSADGMSSRLDPEVPVIVLTGRASEADRVRGFARGADDYLVKPFHYGELLGRVRAVIRRAEGRPQRGIVRVGDLTLDPVTRAVRLAGRPVHLSAKEFALLQALAEEPTRVRSKNELLRNVWGYISIGQTRTVDAHACRLRKKLRGTGRPWVVNVRGVGYRLTEAL